MNTRHRFSTLKKVKRQAKPCPGWGTYASIIESVSRSLKCPGKLSGLQEKGSVDHSLDIADFKAGAVKHRRLLGSISASFL